jgi:hypothetical protein
MRTKARKATKATTTDRAAGELEPLGEIIARLITSQGDIFARKLKRYGGTQKAQAAYRQQTSADDEVGAQAPSVPRECRTPPLDFSQFKSQRRP